MKKLIKIAAVSAVVLSLTAFGVNKANARGWPIAVGVASGVAAGAIVGSAVAAAVNPPVYYAPYAPYAPGYPAPAPVVVAPRVVVTPPAYYGAYPCFYPRARVGWGWGWGRPYHGFHHFRRW